MKALHREFQTIPIGVVGGSSSCSCRSGESQARYFGLGTSDSSRAERLLERRIFVHYIVFFNETIKIMIDYAKCDHHGDSYKCKCLQSEHSILG
jgi:hypothetical protein